MSSTKPAFPPGTRVALYLRRSDAKQEESIETQRSVGTRYCDARGWVIAAEYIDDGISRAEFVRRRGLTAMLVDAESTAPSKRRKKPREWSVVVCSESSRLGGDMQRTPLILQTLIDAGCSVVYHRTDELVRIDTSTDRLLLTVRAYTDELEREKTSERTVEALGTLVRNGKAAGGPCYGYRIVNGCYAIDEAQSAVVRRIFDAYIADIGYRAIARRLNEDHVPAPQNAGKRALGLWSRPTVRAILLRERYRGVAKHGREKKMYKGATLVRVARPAEEVLVYETPAIVSPQQWDAVQARMASNPRFAHCVTTRGAPSRYFLVGRTRCAACGGAVFGLARGKRPPVYVCGRRRNGGIHVCTNAMAHPVATTDAAIAAELMRVRTPAVMAVMLRELRKALAAELQAKPDDRSRIEAEIKSVKLKLKRLAKVAMALDGDVEAITDAIREQQAQLKALEGQLAACGATRAALDRIEVYEARALAMGTPAMTPELARDMFASAAGPTVMDAAGLSTELEIASLFNGTDCVTPRSGNNTEQHAPGAVLVPFRVRLATAA